MTTTDTTMSKPKRRSGRPPTKAQRAEFAEIARELLERTAAMEASGEAARLREQVTRMEFDDAKEDAAFADRTLQGPPKVSMPLTRRGQPGVVRIVRQPLYPTWKRQRRKWSP